MNEQFVLIVGTSGMLFLTASIIFFIYLYQRKLIKRKLEYQKVEDLLKKQEIKSVYAMLEGQERAQKRIAAELHDNLGSLLVTINMFADTFQKLTDEKAKQNLAVRISEVAQAANDTTRQIAHSLDLGLLQHFGLETAIRELVDAVNESPSLTVISTVQLEPNLEQELSINVYRILQELVNNTLKHAHATRIRLEVSQVKGVMIIIFSDNGVGFDTGKTKQGFGLQNLASRVDKLEGTLAIESTKNKGTTTIIEIPTG